MTARSLGLNYLLESILIYPVVLCGGYGKRLWPISRKSLPKQFLDFTESSSLLQHCLQRGKGRNYGSPVIMTSESYRFLVAQHAEEICDEKVHIILEPSPKNTAPSILLACKFLQSLDPNAVALVMPSDHDIPDLAAFNEMISSAHRFVDDGHIVVFGVEPDRAETSYGYIKAGPDNSVLAFHEKPELITAQAMLESGNYFWNAGIFLAHAASFLDAAKIATPNLLKQLEAVFEGFEQDHDFVRVPKKPWSKITPASIDTAVIEKSERLRYVPFQGKWSDLGTWRSVMKSKNKDENGNYLGGRVSQFETSNSFILADKRAPLVAVLGMKNVLAVSTSDAVLVADIEKSEMVGEIVEDLRRKQFPEAEEHRFEYRPWGWFERIYSDKGYQVKRLSVLPESSLSMQRHKFRSETWVVVEGQATVQIERDVFELGVSQSTFIAQGTKHRLTNNGDSLLVIVEVQTGTYLGEDDIERFEDSYNRDKVAR